jgi:hypothetical protein
VTRKDVNLEVGCFCGILDFFPWVRRQFEITRGHLEVEFISVAQLTKQDGFDPEELQRLLREEGKLYFNVGGHNAAGALDQHGDPRNTSLARICSLDLAREKYDFVGKREWLQGVYDAVRLNDTQGTPIPGGRDHNLRRLMIGVKAVTNGDDQQTLRFLRLGFCGIFEACKSGGLDFEEAMEPQNIKRGVTQYCQRLKLDGENEWFGELIEQAKYGLDQEFKQAKRAVRQAKELGKTWEVEVPNMPKQQLRVIELLSDSLLAAQAARQFGFDIVILQRPANGERQLGRCQISCSDIYERDGRDQIATWRLDLGQVAAKLRIASAHLNGAELEGSFPDWTKSGNWFWSDGRNSRWYLTEFLTVVMSGSASSPNMPNHKIRHDRVVGIVVENLKYCRKLRKLAGQQEWHHVKRVRNGWEETD